MPPDLFTAATIIICVPLRIVRWVFEKPCWEKSESPDVVFERLLERELELHKHEHVQTDTHAGTAPGTDAGAGAGQLPGTVHHGTRPGMGDHTA